MKAMGGYLITTAAESLARVTTLDAGHDHSPAPLPHGSRFSRCGLMLFSPLLALDLLASFI